MTKTIDKNQNKTASVHPDPKVPKSFENKPAHDDDDPFWAGNVFQRLGEQIKKKFRKKVTWFKKFLDKFKKSKKPKYQHLSPEEEAIAITIAKVLFNALTSFLAPSLRKFLSAHGSVKNNSTIDGYLYLKTLIKTYKKNSYLFVASGQTESQSQVLQKAMNARNAICHGDLHDILTEWEAFFVSWIQVCTLVNDPVNAAEIQKVLDNLRATMDGSTTSSNSGCPGCDSSCGCGSCSSGGSGNCSA